MAFKPPDAGLAGSGKLGKRGDLGNKEPWTIWPAVGEVLGLGSPRMNEGGSLPVVVSSSHFSSV